MPREKGKETGESVRNLAFRKGCFRDNSEAPRIDAIFPDLDLYLIRMKNKNETLMVKLSTKAKIAKLDGIRMKRIGADKFLLQR